MRKVSGRNTPSSGTYLYQSKISLRKMLVSRGLSIDAYKVDQLKRMLAHEARFTEEHYGAKLSHWYGDAKTLTIDAGGLRALIDYYSNHRRFCDRKRRALPLLLF